MSTSPSGAHLALAMARKLLTQLPDLGLSRMALIPRWIGLALLAGSALGCSAPGEEHEDLRRTAYTNYGEGVAAFESNDRAMALEKLSAALEGGGLNPDAACDAQVKL